MNYYICLGKAEIRYLSNLKKDYYLTICPIFLTHGDFGGKMTEFAVTFNFMLSTSRVASINRIYEHLTIEVNL